MTEFHCPDCDLAVPHDHGTVTSRIGVKRPAIIYRSDADPRAEVRDSETGEVIFPAVKGPLKMIEGGKSHD